MEAEAEALGSSLLKDTASVSLVGLEFESGSSLSLLQCYMRKPHLAHKYVIHVLK